MTLCINPVCPQPNRPNNANNRFCQVCGSLLEFPGGYRVMRLLSDKTGWEKVYEAIAQGTAKIIKVLNPKLNSNAKALALFQQEASVLGQINHPGIVQVDGYFEFQTNNGMALHCIVMEKIDGFDLEQWLQRRGNVPISEAQAIAWLQQLVEVLQLIHNKSYFHRNLKPSNIMVRLDGQLVLTGFATARELIKTSLIKSGAKDEGMSAIISSGYIAPEQINGEARIQSDFFALGRTFVFLLTGKHSTDIDYDNNKQVLYWREETAHVSPLVLDMVDWLMAPQLGKRPLTTQDILRRLKDIERQLTPIPTINFIGSGTSKPQVTELNRVTINNDVIEVPLIVSQMYEPVEVTENVIASARTLPPLEPMPVQPKKQKEKLLNTAVFSVLLVVLGLTSLAALAFLKSPEPTLLPTAEKVPFK